MTEKKVLKRTAQFSLAGLLLLALWFAGSAAGYRNGYRSGYTEGQTTRESEEPYFEKYLLYNKLLPGYDPADPSYSTYDPILNEIYQKAAPDSWMANGGIGEIVLDIRSTTIAVFNEKAVHDQIEALLANMPDYRDINEPSSNSVGGYSQEAYGGFGYGNRN